MREDLFKERHRIGDTGDLGVKLFILQVNDCSLNYGDVMRDFQKIVENPQIHTWLWSTREQGSQIKPYGEVDDYYDAIRTNEEIIHEFRLEKYDDVWYMYDNEEQENVIIECRKFNIDDLYCLCLENDFYEAGTNEDYEAMLEMARKAGGHVKTDDIKHIAEDILDHSTKEIAQPYYDDPYEFRGLMQMILQCTWTWFEEEI